MQFKAKVYLVGSWQLAIGGWQLAVGSSFF
jgi:hypothetical protein